MRLTLNAPEPAEPGAKKPLLDGDPRPNGGRNYFGRKIPAGRDAKGHVNSANAGLKSQLSAVVREQLLGELKGINVVDAAAIWARRALQQRTR